MSSKFRTSGPRTAAARQAGLAVFVLAVFVLAAFVQGCGKEAPPQPPIRTIPRAATDLAVSQRGAGLLLECSYPELTTAGRALASLAAIEILRLERLAGTATPEPPAVDPRQFAAAAKLAVSLAPVDFAPFVRGDRLAISLPVPAADAGSRQTFGLRFVGPGGERSELSNLVTLTPRATPLPPPARLEAEGRPEGIALGWAASAEPGVAGYNIYRRADNERLYGVPLGTVEGGATTYVDSSAQLGQRYVYSVTAVASTSPLVESAITAEHQVDYRDRFAPPVPEGLLALAEADAARLSWAAVDAADLAGYHVYQQLEGGSEWVKRTSAPLASPSFRATGLEPGRRYHFRVTSVDTAGNESAPSAEAAAAMP